jgi:hypothetical protein
LGLVTMEIRHARISILIDSNVFLERMRALILGIALTTFLTVGCEKGRRPLQFDVIVYGGTPAGATAAIQLARDGKLVAIVAPESLIGGIMANGLGGSDIDNHQEFQNSPAVGGLALEFYRRVARHYGYEEEFEQRRQRGEKYPSMWRFEPHVAEQILREWLKETHVEVFLNSRLKEGANALVKRGNRIETIRMEDGSTYEAKLFIDATLEGDLLKSAGVTTTWGREDNLLYGETKNGIRKETTHAQFTVDVDPYIVPGDSTSGLIPTIQPGKLGEPGKGDKSIQAYCFRVCLTQQVDNLLPFRKPKDYDRSLYEIYIRYLKAGGKLYTPRASIPNGKTDLGAWHDLSHNLYGMNYEYPEGNYETRDRIVREHRTFTEGLFYFLANDDEVGMIDPELQREWKSWGLCKDEFRDNDGWPRQLYVRDARRMVSDYVITEHHTRCKDPVPVPDPVAVAYWPPDLHSVRRIVVNGYAYNEGFVFGGNDWRPFGISYRALVPKREECTNILTPTCISASHVAHGAIRIEFTYMALGQACGVAAALAVGEDIAVQDVDYQAISAKLIDGGQVISAEQVGLPTGCRR